MGGEVRRVWWGGGEEGMSVTNFGAAKERATSDSWRPQRSRSIPEMITNDLSVNGSLSSAIPPVPSSSLSPRLYRTGAGNSLFGCENGMEEGRQGRERERGGGGRGKEGPTKSAVKNVIVECDLDGCIESSKNGRIVWSREIFVLFFVFERSHVCQQPVRCHARECGCLYVWLCGYLYVWLCGYLYVWLYEETCMHSCCQVLHL